MTAPGGRRPALLAALLLAGFIPLLVVVPTLVPGDPSVLSAASVEGYNTGIAYQVALLWAVLGIVAAIVTTRIGWLPAPAAPPAEPTQPPTVAPLTPRARWLERGVVAVLVAAALWPWWLARYGTYVEDNIFATALHRMHGGLLPYRDFEFLYGPLMLVPASWWSGLVGYSLKHYYLWLAILEVGQYVLLISFLQHLVPRRRERLLIFLALAALLANPLLGINYNGIRRLLPLGALLLLARDPVSARGTAGAGLLLGLSVAYSHEFGLVASAAAAGLYAVLWIRRPQAALVTRGLLLGVVSVVTWLAVALLLLGEAFPAYLADTRGLVARFGAGEAGFRFYWTGNALAAFGLLSIGAVVLGRSLARRDEAPAWGDRFFVAAMFAALLSLKSGLNRSDVWHVGGAFFALVVAFLLPLPRRTVVWSAAFRRVVVGLIAGFAATSLLGNAPTAVYVAHGWLRGARDALTGVPLPASACPDASEAPCIGGERSRPREDYVALGAWLAEPAQRGRRVLFYGRLWTIGEWVGVYKRDHLNDAFIYDDARGHAVGRWLAERPDAIVVIATPWYERLIAPPGADSLGRESPFQPSLVKSAGEWLTSVHFRGMVTEWPLGELRWRRTVGVVVRSGFAAERRFGELTVLTRRSVR